MKRAAFLCLLAGGCAIAFAPIFVRLSETGPVASAFWRCALATPLLWIWAWRESPSPPGAGPGEGHKQWGALILAGLFFAGDLGVWHFSILFTSVATSTVLANLAPIFVTLFGWLVWKTRVTGMFLVGMVAAIVGMFVLVGPEFRQGGQPLLGDLLGALTGAFYGGYMLAVKVARDRNMSRIAGVDRKPGKRKKGVSGVVVAFPCSAHSTAAMPSSIALKALLCGMWLRSKCAQV